MSDDLVLRAWRETDAPTLLRLYRTTPDLVRQLPTLDDLGQVRELIASWNDATGWLFALAENGVAVGHVSAAHLDRTNSTAWISYWLAMPARRRGLATRAVCTLANYALFEAEEPVFRLELGHRVDNPASGAVARAAGFVQEGLERQKLLYDGVRYDTLIYARLRSDPCPEYHAIPTQ